MQLCKTLMVKRYRVYDLKHNVVEMLPNGKREDSATQLLICETQFCNITIFSLLGQSWPTLLPLNIVVLFLRFPPPPSQSAAPSSSQSAAPSSSSQSAAPSKSAAASSPLACCCWLVPFLWPLLHPSYSNTSVVTILDRQEGMFGSQQHHQPIPNQ